MLFYIEYGCSKGHEALIVSAEDNLQAELFAEQCAIEEFESYDNSDLISRDKYDNDDEYWDVYEDTLANDIHYLVADYDEKNELHKDCFEEFGIYEI